MSEQTEDKFGGMDYALTSVPQTARINIVPVSLLWLGYVFFFAMSFCTTIAQSVPFPMFLWGAFLGAVSLAFIASISSIISSDTGQNFAQLTRLAFGSKAWVIPAALAPLIILGWNSLLLDAASSVIVQFFGWGAVGKTIICLVFGVLFSITAVGGHKFIAILSYIAIPLLVILIGIGFVVAVVRGGGFAGLASMAPQVSKLSWGMTVGVFISFWITGGTCVTFDILRFAKNRYHSILVCAITFVPAYLFQVYAYGCMGIVTKGADMGAIFAGLGLLGLGAAIVIPAAWTSADNEYWYISNTFSELTRFRRSPFSLAAGIIAGILSAIGVTQFIIPWLILLGIILPGIPGVIWADYFVVNRCRYPEPESVTADGGKAVGLPAVKISTMIAWICSMIVSYVGMRFGGIGPLMGIATAFIVHSLIGLYATKERFNQVKASQQG